MVCIPDLPLVVYTAAQGSLEVASCDDCGMPKELPYGRIRCPTVFLRLVGVDSALCRSVRVDVERDIFEVFLLVISNSLCASTRASCPPARQGPTRAPRATSRKQSPDHPSFPAKTQ
jgi:hypothetical protein